MLQAIEWLYGFLWGAPALLLILGTGIWLSVKTRWAQFRLFPAAVRDFFRTLTGRRKTADGVSSFQALCTALAATVGIGNLAGVAGAITLGGPGAVFWMWMCAILGMMIKFAEVTLAVHFRTRDQQGDCIGGPMYMICRGLGKKWTWLAGMYSFFGVAAAFGVGNATQINAVVTGIHSAAASFGGHVGKTGDLLIGIALAVLVGIVLWGGAQRIGRAAERLIPFAAGGYVLLCVAVLLLRISAIPSAFTAILQGAFSPRAVTGGMIGSAMSALRVGVSRGVFTNEAGMGTASIAHALANVSHPAEQGKMGIMEVFLDTIVICTLTALVILCSGVSIPYGTDSGAALTTLAFSTVLGDWAGIVIALALCLFAFATVLGWGLYGARCAQFLFGQHVWRKFTLLQMAAVVLGAVMQTGTLWRLAEICNGLMALPNLTALLALSPVLIQIIQDYNPGRNAASGGTYENIH